MSESFRRNVQSNGSNSQPFSMVIPVSASYFRSLPIFNPRRQANNSNRLNKTRIYPRKRNNTPEIINLDPEPPKNLNVVNNNTIEFIDTLPRIFISNRIKTTPPRTIKVKPKKRKRNEKQHRRKRRKTDEKKSVALTTLVINILGNNKPNQLSEEEILEKVEDKVSRENIKKKSSLEPNISLRNCLRGLKYNKRIKCTSKNKKKFYELNESTPFEVDITKFDKRNNNFKIITLKDQIVNLLNIRPKLSSDVIIYSLIGIYSGPSKVVDLCYLCKKRGEIPRCSNCALLDKEFDNTKTSLQTQVMEELQKLIEDDTLIKDEIELYSLKDTEDLKTEGEKLKNKIKSFEETFKTIEDILNCFNEHGKIYLEKDKIQSVKNEFNDIGINFNNFEDIEVDKCDDDELLLCNFKGE